MRTTTLAAAILCLSACGPREKLPSHVPWAKKAHTDVASGVQVWDIGQDLAARKKTVVDTCRQAGAADDLTALVLAAAMQESQSLSAHDRDASKDGTPAANYSAFNMNRDCLNRLGLDDAACAALNDDANLPEAVRTFLKGLAQMTPDGFMCFHRGGITAFQDRCSYGAQDYVNQMRRVQSYLLQHREMWTSGQRIGAYLEHV